MKVGDITKMDHSRNKTYNSMLPLIWILRIFCLNCNIEKATCDSGFLLFRNLVTTFVLGCLNFSSLYYKIKYIYYAIDISIKVTDSVQIIYDFFQYVVDLYFVYKYGRHICVEYFKQYECIDSILKVSCYSMMKIKLLKRMVFFFVIWTISTSFDFGAWCLIYGVITTIVHSISYLYLFIKMLTILDLIAHVIQIEVRLRNLGDMVQSCYSSIKTGPGGIAVDCVSNKRWLYMKIGKKLHVPVHDCNDIEVVKSLTSCYLLLTEQVSFINKIYGFRVLLNSLSFLSDMTKLLNLAVRIILGSERTVYNRGYYPAMSSLCRLLTCAAVYVTLVNQCENAYRQRERIVNIMDHLLFDKNPDDDLRTAVVNFRELIQNRPVIFNMANFFNLNYSLLVSLASVVVTYTIILLQSVH